MTGIKKCYSYYKVWKKVITKCGQKLLQRVTESYYKVWQVLESVPKSDRYYIVWNKVITKFDRYYKLGQLLQSDT